MDIQLIKTRINCIDYAQRIGLSIKRAGDRCTSPLRAGARNKTSFVVYTDFFYDFGEGIGGDVIDFCALYSHGGDRGEAIRELARLTGVEEDPPSEEWVSYTQNLCNKVAKWHSQLTTSDRDYLHNRGINDTTISELMIGRTDDGRLSIPYFKNGYAAYYITRHMPGGANPDSKYMKQAIDGMCEHIPWGLGTLNRRKDILIIAEGAFDIMSFYQEGFACLSAITGHFSKAQMPTVLSAVKTFEKVFLIYDNDVRTKAGEKFTIKMAKILLGHKIPFIVGQVPSGYKDVSEYYADGGNLQELIDEAKDGIKFLCSNIKDPEEFEAFARKVTRYMPKTDITAFFTIAMQSGSFDEGWLKVLQKDCSAAPSEDYIAKQVEATHTLLYNPRIGFHEYNGKHWSKIPDELVMKYIGDEFGVYRTGGKLSSTLKIVKSDCTTDAVFNIKPIINFINGTLELEPKITFRNHSREDLCTYVLPYPYDAQAKFTDWERFIDSVTDGDSKKASLLQEASGYILYPDNRLQKCFVLIGSGANGKSVFLNLLSKVFGGTESGNISNVEMSSLGREFHAIALMTSMLNISAETRTDVSGAESMFKQIVAGDTITDSFKGKDRISFTPRAKMFLSCNEYMKSKDSTDGWLRRFCFINFPLKFVEHPTMPHERLMDKNIEEKLAQEISGIFNWILEGYKQLKVTGYFTEPEDHTIIQEEFKESINPLITFIKEFSLETETFKISNEDFYKEYKKWCEEAGHNGMARQNFLTRARKIIEEYRPDLHPYKRGSKRGYEREGGQITEW